MKLHRPENEPIVLDAMKGIKRIDEDDVFPGKKKGGKRQVKARAASQKSSKIKIFGKFDMEEYGLHR